jgi:hypothetical protein
MTTIDMKKHDAVAAIIDDDPRIVELKARTDTKSFEAHPGDEAYYYDQLAKLRWRVLTEMFGEQTDA